MDYQMYLKTWAKGIYSELLFWENFVSNEGGNFFYGFNKTVSSSRSFSLENDIPKERYGTEYSFIDVGSGPFSRCGRITTKVKLNVVAVDPLANAYKKIKEKYGVDNGVPLISGFVELLDKQFSPNSFDMVHMSNSLDHCFSAIDGIYQLLNICKIGGKVILRHHENEAENEGYEGLHQWNLSLHNPEKSFVIWRNSERYNICELFKEYADFELYADVQELGGHWIYNKVIMTKKKDVDIPPNTYYEIMLTTFFEVLLNNYLDCIEKAEERGKTDIDKKISLIKHMYHDIERTRDILHSLGLVKIAIYGMGNVGKNLCYVIEQCGVTISQKIDQMGADSGCYDATPLSDIGIIDADAVIISIDSNEVFEQIAERYSGKIYLLKEFLDFFV